MGDNTITTQCCIAGGGPAGMMLGFLLARGGIDVMVLEKHGDFLRDFRGDTIHPSTLELMRELGLLDEFLQLPHYKVDHLDALFGDTKVTLADLTRLPTHCKFVAFMPQWDFLKFLATHGERYRGFHLMMKTEATDLVYEGDRVAGVRARKDGAEIEINADLVVAADGRHSTLRETGRLRGSGHRRADGRAVDAHLAPGRRRVKGRIRPHRHGSFLPGCADAELDGDFCLNSGAANGFADNLSARVVEHTVGKLLGARQCPRLHLPVLACYSGRA